MFTASREPDNKQQSRRFYRRFSLVRYVGNPTNISQSKFVLLIGYNKNGEHCIRIYLPKK